MATATSKARKAPGRAPASGMSGEQTFQAVLDLEKQGMKRSEAFAKIGQDTGRTAPTVATAFYRVSRKHPDIANVNHRPRNGSRVTAPATQAPAQPVAASSQESNDDFSARVTNFLAALTNLSLSANQLIEVAQGDQEKLLKAEAMVEQFSTILAG